jgi:hypothetical protein
MKRCKAVLLSLIEVGSSLYEEPRDIWARQLAGPIQWGLTNFIRYVYIDSRDLLEELAQPLDVLRSHQLKQFYRVRSHEWLD